MSDIKIETGKRMLELRKAKGKNQSDVASYLGLTVAAYQNYETGRREAGYETLCKLAEYFGVTVDCLFGREPAPDPFGELGLSAEDEQDVLNKYMSLPENVRAIMLDVLRQLGGAAQEREAEAAEQITAGILEKQLADDAEAQENAG